ncbi:MAG: cell wall-binding protein [Clostridiales bacterium]|nr:cell wall-binding protein [Clostridiales bacterium]
MRKQTKVVAVASAAALLAIGASMTSFAAAGWVEEDGVWYYYDSDGNIVEDEWKKSGDNWYWLDGEEGGAMATDKLIDDDGDYYYVDASGVMVKNTWVKVVNDEQDDDEDPAEYHYYYMQSSGKAYTAGDSDSTKFKTIDGKRYAFDDDGIMLYGWVDDNAEMQNDDDGWASVTYDDAMYYCGSWEDGAMKTGWQYIEVYDDDEDDDMNYWFYFQSNGKRYQKKSTTEDNYRTKKINGKRYGFDERGVMVYQWVMQTDDASASSASASTWQYFSSPEDGARMTKGWFKVIPPNEDNTFDSDFTDPDGFDPTDADDEDEDWYYADSDGVLYSGVIKKIKGKYYGFQPDNGQEGASSMLSGLVLIKVNDEGEILDVEDDGIDSDELSDLLDGDYDAKLSAGYTLYYFGSSDDADTDGAMKTGSTTINLDGDSYNFYFQKSGGTESRGAGITGIDDDKYIYKAGVKIKADSDDKYIAVLVEGDNGVDTAAEDVTVTKIDSTDLRNGNAASVTGGTETFKNEDGDTLRYVVTAGEGYYLVNSSGTIQKNKTAAKDGDDWYFYVADYEVKLYANQKELTPDDSADDTYNLDNWKNWETNSDGSINYNA